MKKNHSPVLTGNLDIFVIQKEEDFEGEVNRWHEILIHGDPEGLRSFAALLMKLADTNQNADFNLPVGAREHVHLRPRLELSNSSEPVIVGRLDAKGTGAFYDRYIAASR